MKKRCGIILAVSLVISLVFGGCHDNGTGKNEQTSSGFIYEELSSDMNEVTASNAEISSLVDEASTEQESTSAKVSSEAYRSAIRLFNPI